MTSDYAGSTKGDRLGVPYRKEAPAKGVHPIVRRLLEVHDATGMTDAEWTDKAGYNRTGPSHWRRGSISPTLQSLSDHAEVHGYKIILVPMDTPEADSEE